MEEDDGLFDTFGVEKMQRVKPSYHIKPIFNWLKEIGLEEVYELMCEAGYDDVKTMVNQMLGPLPITDDDLKESGIAKPGHRLRILLKLEQDAGIIPKLKLKKNIETGGFLQCCLLANNATRNLAYNSLIDWLENLGLGSSYTLFVQSGFDNYESLVFVMASSRPFNSKYLEEIVGIKNKESRSKILKRLEKDLEKYYNPMNSVNISFDEPKSVACESCFVF